MFPFMNFNRKQMKTFMGIPVVHTIAVTASTTEVRYSLSPCEYRQLPKEGLFILEVRQAAPTGSAALPVALQSNEIVPDNTSMLVNALNINVLAADLVLNGRYLVYYNKCTKTYQLVNAYTPAPAAV